MTTATPMEHPNESDPALLLGHKETWFDLWLRVALTGAGLLLLVFGTYELIERMFLQQSSPGLLHALHIIRGTGSAILLGTWAFFRIRAERLRAEVVARQSLLDLERRVAERTKELEEARAFTELLFDSLREQILVKDPSGQVIKANRSALQGTDAESSQQARSTPLREEGDEQGKLWEIESIPVHNQDTGLPRLVLEVRRDVTARRSLEAQVRHSEKMAGLGLMAAGFAHDLGNPLASLSSELELLEGESDVQRLRESLSVLQQHVRRMSRTLREMVDFSRRRRDQCTDVSIAAVVGDTIRLVHHDPRWKRVKVELDVPVSLPPVHIVEDHLLLVLLNLFLNAADAMPEGGTITVAAHENGGHVQLRVKDTGCGMSAEVLQQATRPMFTTKPPGIGTGLGLSVSSDVIRGAGGTLSIVSAPDAGTEVQIQLPSSGTARASSPSNG